MLRRRSEEQRRAIEGNSTGEHCDTCSSRELQGRTARLPAPVSRNLDQYNRIAPFSHLTLLSCTFTPRCPRFCLVVKYMLYTLIMPGRRDALSMTLGSSYGSLLPTTEDFDKEAPKGSKYDVVAISEGTAIDLELQGFWRTDNWGLTEGLGRLDTAQSTIDPLKRYESANVLWVCRKDGIAYRNGLGRIERQFWLHCNPQWVDIKLE